MTAISRLACSRPERSLGCCVGRWLGAALLLFVLPLASAQDAVSLRVDRISHPLILLEELRLDFVAGGGARLSIERARFGGQRLRRLRLECGIASLSAEHVSCRDGRLWVGGARRALELELRVDLVRRTVDVAIDDGGGIRLRASLGSDGSLTAQVGRLDLGAVAAWLPALQVWQAGGVFSGELRFRKVASSGQFTLRGELADGRFGTADGLRAAEKLVANVAIAARFHDGAWSWSADAEWRAGAAYWHPFYIEAGPVLRAEGRLDDRRLEVAIASLAVEGVRQLAFSARVDLAEFKLRSAALSLADADLAVIGPRWLAPSLAPADGERLHFSGSLSAGLRFDEGMLTGLDLVLDAATLGLAERDRGELLHFGPVSGHLPWQRGRRSQAHFDVDGGRWQGLALGAFALGLRLDDDQLQFDRIRIPVLDGALELDGLKLRRDAGAWEGSGAVVLEPISMSQLTAALGLPEMRGVLAASMPGLRLRPGEIALDGALVISVFGGYLQATGLRVREAFGVASHLSADVELRHLDLGLLTETFSFGSMTGYIDADIRGLELANWQPVRFDARIASSAGSYPRRISQRAVQNIGALGGTGGMTALQRGLFGLFDTFGYSEIGFRCVLDRDVCLMDGIDGQRADGGFVIVRGGGVPALDVIGYNRHVAWRELIARLRRVLAENVAPVVH